MGRAEMHPGFVVYSPETLLRLRAETGPNIGCNFDPSHLFWQGIDPCLAVRKLGEAIFHVHAKDTRIYEANSKVNGVLDTKPYGDEINRSWIFRTVGFGHGPEFWTDFISTLSMIGYNGVISIEHEDSLMSLEDGLEKQQPFSVRFLFGKSCQNSGGPSIEIKANKKGSGHNLAAALLLISPPAFSLLA